MKILFWIVIGYLSGSVLYGYLLPKYLCHVDVTECSRDGNPGSANAFLHAGVPVGIASLLLELGKGFVPVFFAARVLDVYQPLFGLVMAAPVLGHAFPWWKREHGGKAIAVSFGVLLGLAPEWRPVLLLAFFYLLFSLVVVITPHFYRSVVTFALFSICCMQLVENRAIVSGCILLSAVVVWKHFARYQGERFGIRSPFRRRIS